jgi:hypothetical protein
MQLLKSATLNSAASTNPRDNKTTSKKNGVVNPAYCQYVHTIKCHCVHSDILWCERKRVGVFSICSICHCLVISRFMLVTCAEDTDSVKRVPSLLN